MRLKSKIADKITSLRSSGSFYLTWDNLATRIEAVSGVVDSDKILRLRIGCPLSSDKFDLCAVVRDRWDSFFARLIYTNWPYYPGYLLCWNSGGMLDWKNMRKAGYPKPNKLEIPNYRERRVWDSITWGELKELVKNHPSYAKHGRIGLIDLSACKASDIEIHLRGDKEVSFADRTGVESDLMISGRAKDEPATVTSPFISGANSMKTRKEDYLS